MRLKPDRSASDTACRSVLYSSMKTMSVRGTMTSRTMVLPRSKTEWIIRRSPESITELVSARSTSSRSSASVENGPSTNPLPGVTAFPIMISSLGRGPSTVVSRPRGPAAASETVSAFCRPRVRGATPQKTNDTTIMTPAATAPASQVTATWVKTTLATRTIAEISRTVRTNSAVLR